MYTGIIQEVGQIKSLKSEEYGQEIVVACSSEFLLDLQTGASVAINGTCFTVVAYSETSFVVQASVATLDITNISALQASSPVNLERSAKLGDENGGHALAGHVAGTAEIVKIQLRPTGELHLRPNTELLPYIFPKGYLAVDGISLTVASVDSQQAKVTFNIIPETIKRTNLSHYQAGDRVNIEIDATTRVIVDTINASALKAMKP